MGEGIGGWFSCLFGSTEYTCYIASLFLIYLLLSQSLNLVLGVAGLFCLSHIASFALGAYTTALLATKVEAGVFLSLFASGVVAGVASLAVGATSLRLSQDSFAVGTLAFALTLIAVITNWTSFTGGVLGIPGIPPPAPFGLTVVSPPEFLLLCAGVSIIPLLFLLLVWSSPFARALRASVEFEGGVTSLGYGVAKLRVCAVVIAASIAGVAGSLFAYLLTFIDPSSFALHEMVLVLAMVVLGRPGSFLGVTVATLFMVLLPEALRCIDAFQALGGALGHARQLIYGGLLLVVIWILRDKLFPPRRRV